MLAKIQLYMRPFALAHGSGGVSRASPSAAMSAASATRILRSNALSFEDMYCSSTRRLKHFGADRRMRALRRLRNSVRAVWLPDCASCLSVCLDMQKAAAAMGLRESTRVDAAHPGDRGRW